MLEYLSDQDLEHIQESYINCLLQFSSFIVGSIENFVEVTSFHQSFVNHLK